MEGVGLNDLGDELTEFLRIQDVHKLASKTLLPQSSGKNENSNLEKEDECEDPHQMESTILTSEKYLSKCATFPCFGEKALFAVSVTGEDEDEEEEDDLTAAMLKQNDRESVKPANSQPILLPTPLKIVSAMKGSREKQVMPPKKLTVTWAPGVYDPPSAPTFVGIKKPGPKSESKNNGKNKRKGKPSKGSNSKDRKQVRKHGGSSNN